jgi:hypothetical protein
VEVEAALLVSPP